jgi:hypothetical protein
MTDIERKAEGYAGKVVELLDDSPSVGAIEGLIEAAFLAGSKEGQREAFEAGYDVGLADAFINDRTSQYYRGRVDGLTEYLSRKEKTE